MKSKLIPAFALFAAACGGSLDVPVTQPPDAGAVSTCAFGIKRQLTLPSDDLSNTLAGESRNRSTTCTTDRGTGGPDDFYLLRVTTRIGVEIASHASIDTALAIAGPN